MINRSEYIAGLRTLADLLERHDELPLPYDGTLTDLMWIETAGTTDDQRNVAQTFARLIPGTIRKEVRDGYFDLYGAIRGVKVQMILQRNAVCTRRVVATREVTEEVPDPNALAAVPTVTVTKTVEDVEWDCGPLLAPSREQLMQEAANDGFIDNYDSDMDAPGADDYLDEVHA